MAAIRCPSNSKEQDLYVSIYFPNPFRLAFFHRRDSHTRPPVVLGDRHFTRLKLEQLADDPGLDRGCFRFHSCA